MNFSARNFLASFGLSNEEVSICLKKCNEKNGIGFARVIKEDKNLYHLQCDFEIVKKGVLKGNFYHEESELEAPCVGDWVEYKEAFFEDSPCVINEIVTRRNVIKRLEGSLGKHQTIAANVDYAFIVTSLNRDLNYRRIERYLTMLKSSDVYPFILLTKVDLEEDYGEEELGNLKKAFPNIEILRSTQSDFKKFADWKKYLPKGSTSVFIGSSGVGKSTLINFLLGKEALLTGEIRDDDDRGKHTTTYRYLSQSRFGGLIIDTPGMRELSAIDAFESVLAIQDEFSDVVELISRCRFSDCKHQSEPGCKILAALASGELEKGRFQNYLKILNVNRFLEKKNRQELVTLERKGWKRRSVANRRDRKIKEKFNL